MQNNLFRKGLVLGLILLFVGVNIVSGFNKELEAKTLGNTRGDILYVGGSGPGNYSTIQSAINDANPGDTIFVYNGTYYEHITINKQLFLIGEGKNITIIDGGGSGNAVYITGNSIHICGFTIRNYGNSRGMYLVGSSNNRFYRNHFEHSGYETLERIRFESSCNNNWFHNNTISGINIRTLYNCDYNLWENNSFENGGITLNPDGHYNTIRYNYFGNNSGCGPEQRSHYNEVYGNTFVNGWFAIADVQESHGNVIYQNNFIDCWINVKFSGNYMYNPTLQEGNYWSDFDEPSEGAWDNNSDGIVDSPYTVPGAAGAQDLYPLMYPWYPTHPDTVYVDDDYNISTLGYGYDKFNRIQYGINEVGGSTVFVYSGVYYENVVIDKIINLIGENKGTTIIDGGGSGDVVYVSADWINISGFTIKNSGSNWNNAGIYVASDCNTISDNNAILNGNFGLLFYDSSDNIVSDNNLSSNDNEGASFQYFSNSIVLNNIFSFNDGNGMCLYHSDNNTISNNHIILNKNGINIDASNSNSIIDNEISLNSFRGIFAEDFGTNDLYHNNFRGNNPNAYEQDECLNNWDNGYPSGGNYWGDYNGTDADGDGIGDTPYLIPDNSNQDNYPLIFPWGENPPVADFIFNVEESPVIFDGSSSYDRDGEIVSFEWDFGDGTTGEGEIVYHKYCEVETYYVTLTVTDDDGLIGNITECVDVLLPNIPPSLEIYGPNSGKPGEEYEYVFIVTDPDDDEFYLWVDWGDGDSTGWMEPLSEPVVKLSHKWNHSGTYVIKAKVKDFCDESEWAEFEVIIPRNRMSINSLFLRLLERFLDAFPMMKHLLRFINIL